MNTHKFLCVKESCMRNQAARRVILPLLGLTLALGTSLVFANNRNKAESVDAIGNYSTNASTYYNGITATSGQALAGQLHDLITSTHQYYTSYADNGANGYQKNTDQYYENDSKVSGYIYEFYSGVKWPNGWYPNAGETNGGYNREHCWCQSNSVNTGGTQMWGESGGGADMHHLRPVETRLNSTRSNNEYGEISSRDSYKVYAKLGTNSTYALGGYNSGGTFEPLDSKKGDVARIILYVYLHYNSYTVTSLFGSGNAKTNGSGSSSYFSTSLLSLTKITNQTTEAKALEMLLEWNASDPVDEIEQRRNEQVATYQGNRNPFIDNSNYAEMIWGTGTSNPTVNSVSVSPSSLSLDLNGTTTGNLTATVNVSNGAAQTVTWTSSNTNVATVSSSGVVTAKAKGSCTITATSTVNSNKSASCTVSVLDSSGGGGSTTTNTSEGSVTAASGALSGWTASGTGSAYADGSVKFDTGGDKVTNTSLFSGDVSDNMESITVTINGKINGTPTSTNSYKVEALDSSGNVLASDVKTGDSIFTTSYGNVTFTMDSGLSGCTGLRITYVTKGGGNWGVKSVSWVATYTTTSGSSESALSSITLNTSNVETNFYVDDTFDYSGLVVTAHYEDGTEDIVTPTSVTGPDMSSAGTKNATVSYTENGVTKTSTYSITISSVVLSSIEVSSPKTNYHVGDSFVAPTVYGNYSNNSTSEITSNITFSGYDLSTEGSQTVTVSYGGKTTTYEILVSSASTISDSTQYTLISSTSDLEPGKSYIITNGTSGTVRAISNVTNSNNRKSTEVTISNGKITRGSSVMSFALGGTSGAYTFESENYTGTNGFLASASGDNNYLRVISTAGSSSIEFNDGAATIHIGPSTTRTLICFNTGIDSPNGGFACYSAQGSYGLVYLWKEADQKVLTSISLNTTNVQTSFTVGSTFDSSGLVVTANYDDSSSSVVTPTSVSSPNMSTAGSKTVTVTYTENGVTKTATYTITVNSNPSISWTSPTIVKYTGSTLSGTDVNNWAVSYNDGTGNITVLTYDQLTVKLGGTTISIPHTWAIGDDGKTLTATYNSLTTTESAAVEITQSVNNIYKDIPAITDSVSWSASSGALGGTIASVNETSTGTINTTSSDYSYAWSYTRTLVSGVDSVGWNASSQGAIQLGKNGGVENVVFSTSAIPGTITSISVVCASYQSAHSLNISVGNTSYYSDSTPAWGSGVVDTVTATGSSSGSISITFGSGTRALYIKSISVSYSAPARTEQIANNTEHIEAQKLAVLFANTFNGFMDDTEYCTAGLDAAWNSCSTAYVLFKQSAASLGETEEAWCLNLIKYATRQYSDNSGEACIERMMKTYEVCVQKHGKTAFMSDLVTLGSPQVSPLVVFADTNTNTIAIIVIISLLSVTSIGGYFFIRKRKAE